jgi:D-arabinose 5-phosphate isomerase GutQ
MVKEETKKTAKYDVSVILDCMECCKALIENEDNVKQQYAFADFMRQAFTHDIPVYFTGIGKPGFVAQKAAASLKSVMINAQYIDAITAGHGDLGSFPLNAPSVLVALSKSGLSKELYTLFAAVKKLRPSCTTVMVCMSNDDQFTVVDACADINAKCRLQLNPRELDGFGIVPATSNALFELVLSNAFANALLSAFGTVNVCERLKLSHPSGTLQNKVTALLKKFAEQKAANEKEAAKVAEEASKDGALEPEHAVKHDKDEAKQDKQ